MKKFSLVVLLLAATATNPYLPTNVWQVERQVDGTTIKTNPYTNERKYELEDYNARAIEQHERAVQQMNERQSDWDNVIYPTKGERDERE